MAIKIECAQCGYSNDLGRVFCTQCGQKLDMARTTMSELQARRQFDPKKFVGRLVAWLIFLALVGLVGIAFWPSPRVTVREDASGAAQVPAKARAIKKAVTARQSHTVVFSEAELNGFLAARAKAKNLEAMTIDLKPGAFEIRAWMTWRVPFTNVVSFAGKGIPASRALRGSFEGGKLVVKQGWIGHLPLVGPASGLSASFFADIFADLAADKDVAAALTRVTMDEDKVELKLGQ